MQFNIKDMLKLTAISIIYILVGLLYIYSDTLILLFPILALPMIIWVLSNKQDFKRDVLVQFGIGLCIFLSTQSVDNAILYFINVSIPMYIVTRAYRKRVDVPHIIIYTTLGVATSLYFFVIARSYTGMNYLQSYFNVLDTYQTTQLRFFELAIKKNPTILSATQMDLFKEIIYNQVNLLKYIYPALAIIVVMWLSVIMVFLVTFVGKIRKWKMTSLKQLLHFKLSRGAAAILIIGLLLVSVKGEYANITSMLGLNVYFLIQTLLQLVGIISTIMLIKKTKLSMFVKTMGIVLSFMIFFTLPMLMMMVGLFDTLFNYRKAEIIV